MELVGLDSTPLWFVNSGREWVPVLVSGQHLAAGRTQAEGAEGQRCYPPPSI